MTTSVESIYRELEIAIGRVRYLIAGAGFAMRKHEACPFCHLHLEEYVRSIPPGKFVSVDVPSDLLAAEKVIGIQKLRALIIEANETMNHIKLKE
jgi:hypothetical protein